MASEPAPEPQNALLYLYLTTIGRKTGSPHEIEIWFVEYGGAYYLMSEFPDKSDWVRNIRHTPSVSFRIGSKTAKAIIGIGRRVDAAAEPEMAAAVARLMQAKYEWSDGQIFELKPTD